MSYKQWSKWRIAGTYNYSSRLQAEKGGRRWAKGALKDAESGSQIQTKPTKRKRRFVQKGRPYTFKYRSRRKRI